MAKQYNNKVEIVVFTGRPVVSIHNGTKVGIVDALELVLPCNEIVEAAIEKSMHKIIDTDTGVLIMGHSQGGCHLIKSLNSLKRQLSNNQMEQFMMKTVAGAIMRVPSGPQYAHYTDEGNNVPRIHGLLTPQISRPGNKNIIFTSDDERYGIPPELDTSFTGVHAQIIYSRNRLTCAEARTYAPPFGSKKINLNNL